MLINLLLITLGLGALIYGANLLVDGGSAMARKFNISPMVIGLTVVGFGTSAPELAINVISSLNGESSIAFGNVLGSNIFNILGVLGITAAIYPIAIKKTTARIEAPILVLAAVLILLIYGNNYWSEHRHYSVSRTEGIILLILLCCYFAYIVHMARKDKKKSRRPSTENHQIKQMGLAKSILFIVLGLGGLIVGGELLVRNAVAIAEKMNVSERIIALTIISIGTSAPELVTSIVAAYKKNADIAVGNVVGSCFFNIFAVLGISAVISPITLHADSIVDVVTNLLATVLLYVFIFTGDKMRIRIDRREGVILTAIYVAYILYLIGWSA